MLGLRKFGRPQTTMVCPTVLAAAAILAYQLFIPPIVGLADQGDFLRTIGRFGWGPQHHGNLEYVYVEPKYIPDPQYRSPYWEQANSEYIFVGAALLLNKLVSKDGRLDITVAGFVHALVFLAVFARLLWVTRRTRARALLWIGALVALTDAGYAVYWNSWYAEPAFLVFLPAVAGRRRGDRATGETSLAGILRWSLWSILWILAKPQNAPIGLIVGLFTIRLACGQHPNVRAWRPGLRLRDVRMRGIQRIRHAALRAPGKYLRRDFSGILGDSKNPRGRSAGPGARSATRQIRRHRRLDSRDLLSADGRFRSTESA